MDLNIVPLYAALLGIGLILLSLRVISLRRQFKVALGGGDEPRLERAIRAHGNYSEYVPISIILIAFVEFAGNPAWIIHMLCGLLLVSRVIHAFGVSQTAENFSFRVFGMATTFAVLAICSTILLTGGSLLTRFIG
ncbi:MAG: glutathione metabolism protein [Rhodospirillaceae bacterium]|nr:glutathione metabolism protein [Rhodospirillaceae bacterium]|tara:strand:+ start:1583 stop:1990 length:408 start_codon:yes stop_codon:yes gene_type:complete